MMTSFHMDGEALV